MDLGHDVGLDAKIAEVKMNVKFCWWILVLKILYGGAAVRELAWRERGMANYIVLFVYGYCQTVRNQLCSLPYPLSFQQLAACMRNY
jgi:hypothetical protein